MKTLLIAILTAIAIKTGVVGASSIKASADSRDVRYAEAIAMLRSAK